MTRIPTLFAHERSIEAMNERRAALVRTQEQLSTGKRVNRPSDDPLGSARAERVRSQLSHMELEGRMIGFAGTMLGQAENAMAGAMEVLQSARESLVAAGNGALAPADRALIAQSLRASREELLALANQRDGAGGYVFGGQGSTEAPFAPGGTPVYRSAAGEQSTGLDASFTTSQDGRVIFADLEASGTPQSIFETLDDAIATLEDATVGQPALGTALATGISGVDSAIDRLSVRRTRVGEQMRAIEARQRLIEGGELEARGELSGLVDVDFAAAITDSQKHQTSLEAAMATYARIARLTLFDYV